ncbi:DUF2066 domain-containing protein [Ectothiorhodospiraceae bacterium WFHF3C12]|nr:DUF2066 domain-containing protein [Ectothiorhodospiraceae bacterium WFHF3C12]
MPRRLCCALLLLVVVPALEAATVENLLQVEVPVEDQSAELREEAFRAGLATMAVRLTGRPELAGSGVVAQLRETPSRFVQRFQYQPGDEGLRLQITYYGETLRKALVEADIPVWEANRPPVLVWLAVERQGGRVIVGADQAADTRQLVEEAALGYGLPLLFPKLDGTDRAAVTSSDIWGGFTDPIVQASRRYDTPLIWVGRLEQRGGSWAARWRLVTDDGRSAWSNSAGTQRALMDQAAAELAGRLVGQYAVLPDLDAAHTLRVHVRDVDSAERYARLERYLAGVSGVAGVRLLSVEDNQATYALTLEVPVERVLRDLERSRTLIPVAAPGTGSVPRNDDSGQRALGADERMFRLSP